MFSCVMRRRCAWCVYVCIRVLGEWPITKQEFEACRKPKPNLACLHVRQIELTYEFRYWEEECYLLFGPSCWYA
ncbi:hypothetical protein F4806DRAFT_450265 [Annulohypoxylon nitens]|nr:hypothetical protein F4806DRAFT_450265 [Annulohypoxylon nitens]